MCLSLTTRHVRQQPMGRTTATTMAAVMPACLELCCFRAAERTERKDTALFHAEGSRVRNASSCQPPTLPPPLRAWFKQFPLPFVVRPRLAGREERCERETSKGVVGTRGLRKVEAYSGVPTDYPEAEGRKKSWRLIWPPPPPPPHVEGGGGR